MLGILYSKTINSLLVSSTFTDLFLQRAVFTGPAGLECHPYIYTPLCWLLCGTLIEKNVKQNPGKASLKFNFIEPREQLVASLLTYERGFQINDDMIHFLDNHPDVQVQVNLL